MADHDAALWLLNLWWLRKVRRSSPRAELLVEQPADPSTWASNAEEAPTFLCWPETIGVVEELDLDHVQFNQGLLGHSTTKPTSLLSSVEETMELKSMVEQKKMLQHPWPEEVKLRIEKSKSLAAWAPGLVELLCRAARRICSATCQVKSLNTKEKQTIAAWQAHFDADHKPFRNDCSVCLQGGGRDRQRRKVVHKTSFCLSLDIAGPFQPGVDQVKSTSPKYFLAATISIPVSSEGPLVQGLKDLGFKVKPSEQPHRMSDEVEGEEEIDDGQEGDDPWQRGDGEEAEEVVGPIEMSELAEQEQRWKEFIAGSTQVESKVLSFALPLQSRNVRHVVPAVASIFARIKSMQIPVVRVHTDRAKEFVAQQFKDWCAARDLWHTLSPGDEPTQNSRVERIIGLLKSGVRTVLKASKAPITWWPLALRHVAESFLRDQLWHFGIATPALPAFGTKAVARTKTWHQRGSPWKHPGCKVRIWGPAADMSLSSGGVVVQDEEGRWMRTTVARPVRDPEVDDDGLVTGEIQVPNNRCRGSSPMTVDTPQDEAKDLTGEQQLLNESEELVEAGSGGAQKSGEENKLREEVILDVVQEHQVEVVPLARSSLPKRRRLHGKSTVLNDGPEQPALYACQAGGENEVEKSEQQWNEAIMLVQHKTLQEYLKEELARMQEGQLQQEDVQGIAELKEAVTSLEQRLQKTAAEKRSELEEMALRSIQTVEGGDVLQTQTVSLDEVRKELHEWIPAFREEVNTILESGAMESISEERYQQLLKEHPDLERLPMLAVATMKPQGVEKEGW